MSSRSLVRAALYAALYAALTLAPGLSALAYGQIQFRFSEALMVFACVDPAAVVGLTVGTAIGNLGSPMMPIDLIVGSALTLVSGLVMHAIGPRLLALAAPVIVNGLGVGAMLTVVLELPFWASAAWVAVGEGAVMCTVGFTLLLVVRRHRDVFGISRPAA